MVSINYSSREVCCKIVFYGPGLSGKTTNLQYVHSKVPASTRGKLISLATEADRTLYFDFLPINIGTINGFSAKFQLYTVPGQVYYNATRKLVLRGVDGIVFVADSQVDKMDENIESLMNLEDNLVEYGYSINDLPIVIQYNKRDLPNVLSVEQLDAKLNKRGWPHFEASATIGNGVFDTLKLVIKLVLDKAKQSNTSRAKPVAATTSFDRPSDSQKLTVVTPTAQNPVYEPVAHGAPMAPVIQQQEAPPKVKEQVSIEPAGERIAAYRPYPGSVSQYKPEPQPAPVEKPIETTISDPVIEKQENQHLTMEDKVENRKQLPQMAPSIRRRGETKKRGFFKRLFGLK
jgi:mutual gliding-motility protein MglA